MVYGIGLGIVFGSMFNEVLWGIIFGTGLGLIIDYIYDSKNNNTTGNVDNK